MITLKNIKRNNGVISATYYPESNTDGGYISVDVKTGDIIDFVPAKGYGSGASARHYGRKKLIQLATVDELPSERTVMWY